MSKAATPALPPVADKAVDAVGRLTLPLRRYLQGWGEHGRKTAAKVDHVGDGATPPGMNVGGHGHVDLLRNKDAAGKPLDGSIQVDGKRLNIPHIGRLKLTQKAVMTAMHGAGTGRTGIDWLVLAPATVTLLIATYDWDAAQWSSVAEDGALTDLDPTADDYVILARVVRKDDASAGIEKLHSFLVNSKGVTPDLVATLIAPDPAQVTLTGVPVKARDGTAKLRLGVATTEVRDDQALAIRWRPAAGDYPGACLALDFVAQTYQVDAGGGDPDGTWIDAPHRLRGKDPVGAFGSFDLAEVIDVELRWEEIDAAGQVSDWLLIQNLTVQEDDDPIDPVTDADTVAKPGFNRSKWTLPDDPRLKRIWGFRTTGGTVAEGDTPDWQGHASKWDDHEATVGTAYSYVFITESRSGVVDWANPVATSPVTTRAIKDTDLDPTLPADPATAPTLSQTLNVTDDGTVQLLLVASVATPSDAANIQWALKRDHGDFDTLHGDATPTTSTQTWVTRVGEVDVVEYKSINALGKKSASYSPQASLTIAGDATACATALTPVTVGGVASGVTAKPKGFLLEWAANPTDAKFAGLKLYEHLGSDNAAAATYTNAFTHKAQLKYKDEKARTSGDVVYFYGAAVSRFGVESATRTLIGHATFTGVKGADIETGAVDWTTHVSGSGKPANNADVTASNYAQGVNVDTSSGLSFDAQPSAYRSLGLRRLTEAKNCSLYSLTGVSAVGELTTKITQSTSGAGTIHQEFVSGFTWKRHNSSETAWTAWKQVFDQDRLPDLTANEVAGAKRLAQANPSDIASITVANFSTGSHPVTLTYGTDAPRYNAKVTGTASVTITLVGSSTPTTDGDFRISNHENSTLSITVIGDTSYTIPPGVEMVFFNQGSGFTRRFAYPLVDTGTFLIPWQRVQASPADSTRTTVDVANTTFTMGSDGPTIYHDGAITADRNISISWPSSWLPGMRGRLVRSANSTGAHNLVLRDQNNSNATIYTLTGPSTWVDFEVNAAGAALVVTAAGSF